MFTKQDIRRIASEIAAAERKTSGEIRVHVEMRPRGDAFDQACRVFQRLKMHQTRDRNGVLIFVSPKTRAFAIVADEGILNRVPPGFWDGTRDVMQSHFRDGRFPEGVIEGIRLAADKLKTHFPSRPDDINELPDDVSLSGEKPPRQ